MRGTSLVKLLDLYRGECRLSLSAASNTQDRERQVMHIQRTQEWLWNDYDWPFLRVRRVLNIAAGQRFYSPPDDIPAERIHQVSVYSAGIYLTLRPDITEHEYTVYDPTLDVRSWPPSRWRISEDETLDGEQIEIWPLPSESADLDTHEGQMTVTGIRKLKPLLADSDTADLDDRLIILFCAAEVAQSRGDKDAQNKLQMANKRYASLRGQQMINKKVTLFGVGQPENTRRERIPMAVYSRNS